MWSFGLSLLTVALGRYPLQTEGGYWGLLHTLRDEPSPALPEEGDFSDVFRDFIDQVRILNIFFLLLLLFLPDDDVTD